MKTALKTWQQLALRFALGCVLLAVGLSVGMDGPSGALVLAMPILIPLAITAAVTYGAYYVAAALVIGQYLYGQDQARKAKNRAKDAYNAALQDRMTTIQGGSAPWQIIYGETWVSPVMVAAVLTSGDKDQYKHVVYVWAAHECEAILDFTLAGKSVSVGASGHVNAGKWAGEGTDSDSELVTLSATGTVDLDRYPVRLICLAEDKANPEILYRNDVVLTHLAGGEGGRITVKPEFVATWANRRVWVNYEVPQVATPTMRVRHHLGTADQAADAGLLSDCPADWKATDRGRGLCYSVVRYDLNDEEFQGGPLEARAKIRGRKVYDPRTATTAWTANAALCVDDFIQAEWGKGAAAAQVDTAAVNAAANVCAEQIDYVVKFPDNHTETKQAPRFTINGVVRSDADPDQTLELMCQAMAGNAVRTGGMWSLQAGVYTPPVMDLSDADCLGSVESVPGLPGHEVINSLRGQFYDPLKYGELTDYPPYQNTALVAEDGGRSLWDSRSFPFSDEIWRCWQLARITVEQTRGEVLVFPAKRRALRLKPGQRVRVSLSKLGMVQQVFRVVKREWTVGKPVMLTLQQDDPSVWDMGDAAASLAPTSTRLVDPWVVAPVAGLVASSGSATLLKQGDGTVVARVKLAYTASADALVLSTGALQIEYRRQSETTWQRAPDAAGSSTQAFVLGLEEQQLYVLRARWVNGMGARSDWASTTVLHVGKTAAPDPVQALAVGLVPGALRITWTPCPDADYAETVLRVGASWAASTLLANVGPASTYDWLWPAQGSYKIWAVHLDSSGNQSTPVWVPALVDRTIYMGLPRGGALNADPECSLPSEWVGGAFVTGVAGVPGGTAVGSVAAGVEANVQSVRIVPVSPLRRYRVSAKAFANVAAGAMYLGVYWHNAAGEGVMHVPVSGGWGGGTWSYFGLIGSTPSTSVTDYSAEFGAGTGFPVPAGMAGVKLIAICNYAPNLNGGGSARHYLSDFKIEDVTDVATVSQTATAAASNASAALVRLQAIDSDGVLARGEKPEVIAKWLDIYNEGPGIDAQAAQLGITTERTAWANAKEALRVYLVGLTPAYSDTTQDTLIVPAVDRVKWADYYSARQTLLNKIAAVFGSAGGVNMIWGPTSGSAGPGLYGFTLAYIKTPDSNRFGLLPGEQLTISGDVWQDGASAAAGQYAQLYLYCMDVGGIWTGYTVTVNGSGQAQAGSRGSATLTLPAEAQMRYIVVGLYHQGGTSNTVGTVVCDRVQVERGPVATQYSPGAEPGATVGATWGVNIASQPFTYVQEGTPAGANNESTWLIPSSGRSFKLLSGVWRPFVGPGSVATSELSANAATEFINFFDAAGIAYSNAT
ncbi:hypothetical protein [Paucibacter sp. B51]|uniref:hypothetical protein n=1 Tax=Paucibacter sp. B51 TaxID=2993315 RepID=UPI0022EBE330|nr:hypothetical protein [Paucibacter sp. B51]